MSEKFKAFRDEINKMVDGHLENSRAKLAEFDNDERLTDSRYEGTLAEAGAKLGKALVAFDIAFWESTLRRK